VSALDSYYQDDLVTLYLGDCRTVTEWLAAGILVTDPPYGRSWRSGSGMTNSHGRGRGSVAHGGIAGDDDTATRDEALTRWGGRPAIVFGDPLVSRPAGTVQVLGYEKPIDAGIKGARAGFRRDLEEIYLVGPWPVGVGGRSSVLRTGGLVAGPRGVGTRNGHPHAKPVDVMETLIRACPPGVIADPFAGSGSTLIAARNLGRRAIGVEISEEYCERAALRLSQMAFDLEAS
jgi:site-specific DNA-methyltransferase (adenine-specific)